MYTDLILDFFQVVLSSTITGIVFNKLIRAINDKEKKNITSESILFFFCFGTLIATFISLN